MKTLKLAYSKQRPASLGNDIDTYTVLLVKNSTSYVPGEELTKAEVSELCRKCDWDVITVASRQTEAAS